MKINWNDINTYGRSKSDSFEELCAELAYSEIPSQAKFTRLEAPDGGIECYCEFPGGKKWVWQAKYFEGEFGDTQWRQIDKSVKDALRNYPSITRYYVCVSFNPTGGPETGDPRKSRMYHWKRHVDEWEKFAKERGMDVEFEWCGNWELAQKLDKPENAIIRRRWFSELVLDDDWFSSSWNVARAAAGPRYTPELHIGLPIADKLEMLGRTKQYIDGIKSYAIEIRRWRQSLQRPIHPHSHQKDPSLEIPTDKLQDRLEIVSKQLAELKYEPVGGPTFQDIFKSVQNVVTTTEQFLECLRQRSNEYDAKHKKSQDSRQNPFWDRRMRTFQDLNKLKSLSDNIDAEDKRMMLIYGDAGTGKTHLLCDIAKKRVDDGLPTVLLMGQLFAGDSEPWSQVRGRLDLEDVSLREFIIALGDTAQMKKRRALLMIDAVNEGNAGAIWDDYLATFLAEIHSPWIAVVLSVRSTYKKIVPEEIQKYSIPIEHTGFEGKEYDVVQTFFPYYDLEPPSTPILNPEFGKPLFLKMICEGLQEKGEKRLPRGFQGISKVFDLYLESVNKKLAKKLGYDPDDKYVRDSLMKIAEYLVDKDEVDGYVRGVDKKTVKNIVNQFLPNRSYEQSLYRGMVTEGVLIEDPKLDNPNTEIVVRFSYERFSDHIIANFLLQKHLDKNKPEKAFVKGGGMAFLIDEKRYGLRGLIEALSIQVPELTGKELIELVPELVESKNIWNRIDATEAFRQSIIWRKSDAFSDKTIEFLSRLLKSELEGEHLLLGGDNVLDVLMTVATIPDHPYNATKLLDGLLSKDSMPVRDEWWTTYLHGTYQFEGPVNRLIDWALLILPEVKLDGKVAELASIALTWTLTSSNRSLRDRATKALIALLTGRFRTLHKILKQFADVNDPYVAERLHAVAYGVAMRSHDVEKVGNVAQWVYDNIFADGKPPVHILLRDYARGVVERALYLGAKINVDRNLIEPPYTSVFPHIPTEEEIKKYRVDPNRGSYDSRQIEWSQRKIKSSIFEFEFGRKVIGTDFSSDWLSLRLNESQHQYIKGDQPPPRFDLKQIQRYVFKRVFDLGWTLERFGKFDRCYTGYDSIMGRITERIGKKYQWIAYHEITAYISDHFQYLDEYDEIDKYEGAWQGNFRDIDPSVTLASNKRGTDWEGHKPSWWAQETYTAWKDNDTHATWLDYENDIPKIEKLMKISDSDDISWLNLNASFIWEQPYPADVEASDVDRRELWFKFTGWFVRKNDVKSLMSWEKSIDPNMGDPFPPLIYHGSMFWGEYGWSPAYRAGYGSVRNWIKLHSTCPVSVLLASFDCSYGHSNFDHSVDDQSNAKLVVPHTDLIEKLKLKWTGQNAEFVEIGKEERKPVAYDPTATEAGPTSLLVREDLMRRYLKENELTLFWFVQGEKRILYGNDNNRISNDPSYRPLSSIYLLGSQGPQGKLKFSDPPP